MSKQSDSGWRTARRKALRLLETMTDEEDAEIRRGVANDPDTHELTDADFAKARPAEEVHPDIVAWYRRTRGPQKAPTKKLVSLRLDRDVIEHFRKRGPGWQRVINDTLRRAARLRKKA
jgi:uncharacterized protein (DUF4415 family)